MIVFSVDLNNRLWVRCPPTDGQSGCVIPSVYITANDRFISLKICLVASSICETESCPTKYVEYEEYLELEFCL
jgi:hypothetical protein